MNRSLLILIFVSFSCSSKPDYPYRAELDNFLKNEFDFQIGSNDAILVMLPLDACNPCIKGTIQMLSESKQNNFIIVASCSSDLTLKKFEIDKLNISKENLFIDRKNRYDKYEMGVHAPIILHFREGRCVFYSETTSSNIAAIKTHFGWS